MNVLNNQEDTIFNPALTKFWQKLPLSKPCKEIVKSGLFSCFPRLYKNSTKFQHWKESRIFRNKELKVWNLKFWKRKFFRTYSIAINSPDKEYQTFSKPEKLAVIIHVFYPEIFEEIFALLSKNQGITISLYLTGNDSVLSKIRNSLDQTVFYIQYFPIENRGRDILPFLSVLPKVFDDGHNFVLKLHTKGSNHLKRKALWRHDLFSKLIGEWQIKHALEIFHQNPFVGMIGPIGNILPMSIYYGANSRNIIELAQQMGINPKQLGDLNFVAGSMFYARKEALIPVLDLNLTNTDFEPEAGQTEGTLAHAVERLFPVGLIAANLQLADTAYSPDKPSLTVSKHHYFTR